MVARLTSDQNVGGSIPRVVIYFFPFLWSLPKKMEKMGTKSKSPPLVHEDIFLDSKSA